MEEIIDQYNCLHGCQQIVENDFFKRFPEQAKIVAVCRGPSLEKFVDLYQPYHPIRNVVGWLFDAATDFGTEQTIDKVILTRNSTSYHLRAFLGDSIRAEVRFQPHYKLD